MAALMPPPHPVDAIKSLSEIFINKGWQPNDAKKAAVRISLNKDGLDRIVKVALPYICDFKAFEKGAKEILKNPYHRECFGEATSTLLEGRDKIYDILKADLPHLQTTLKHRRYYFAAWALWAHNKNKLYMPVKTLYAYAHRHDLDETELLKYTRRHPTEKSSCTLVDFYDDEQAIVKFLKQGQRFISMTPQGLGNLDDIQKQVVSNIMDAPFGILQGSAGVGKTTVVSRLIEQYVTYNLREDIKVYCLAFTHKAKRCVMDKLEALGLADKVNVSTIHSFVLSLKQNQDADLPPCLLLVDETSMVDIELMGDLASVINQKALNGYQVVFVGDDMQLPPIGRGELFRLLVERGVNVNKLTKCYRVDAPDLFQAYDSIRKGVLPPSSEHFKAQILPDDKAINSAIGKIINKLSPDDILQRRVQFIAWQNKDVYKINMWIQAGLLKSQHVGPAQHKGYYLNDRVVYMGDNKDSCTNAMTGRVIKVEPKSMTVRWDDTNGTTPFTSDTKDLALAYCMTVHKSQGSEYEQVIVPCYEAEKMASCLDRRWLYTAVTRAKEQVTMIATQHIKEFLAEPVRRLPIMNVVV